MRIYIENNNYIGPDSRKNKISPQIAFEYSSNPTNVVLRQLKNNEIRLIMKGFNHERPGIWLRRP